MKTVTEAQQKYLTVTSTPFETYKYIPVRTVESSMAAARAQTSTGSSRRLDSKSSASLYQNFTLGNQALGNQEKNMAHEINYKYNSIYNRFPGLRNSSDDSNFYINKFQDSRPMSMSVQQRV